MAYKMLVDVDRCIGCWTCAMACKVGNHLEDDEYRVEVETHGSGAGIDKTEAAFSEIKEDEIHFFQILTIQKVHNHSFQELKELIQNLVVLSVCSSSNC